MFHSPDTLTITDADYACLVCEQFKFKSSEATLNVTGLHPLCTIIIESNNTFSTSLINISDPRVCNYLFQCIETTTSCRTSTYLLCFSRQFTSYTTNLIKSLFPILSLVYPTLQITDVWKSPSNHPTSETIAELLAHSKLHLQSVKSFSPYNTSHICPTPIPDTDLPSQRKSKSKRHPGHNNPSPRHTAPLPPPPPQPNSTQHKNQPTVSSLYNRHSSYRHHHPNAQHPPSTGCSNLSLPQPSPNYIPTSQPPGNHGTAQPVHSKPPLIDTTAYTSHSTLSRLFCCSHIHYLFRNHFR